MPEAARVMDATEHGTPLSAGPGSPDVEIGYMPAWRALPASVAGAVEGVSDKTSQFMKEAVLTPASAAAKLAQIATGLVEAAAKAATELNASAAGAASSAVTTMASGNVALSATWATASAVPGGQPAANTAYTEGIKGIVAGAATAVFAAIGGMTDMHNCPVPCPIPPHGPGMVTQASRTVLINNLPAARKGDKVFEACGGPDGISIGCDSVLIGDDTGSSEGGPGLEFQGAAQQQPAAAEASGPSEDAVAEAQAIEATFAQAAHNGSPLVERCPPCGKV